MSIKKPRTYHQRGRFISRKIAIDPKVNSLDDSTFLLFLMLIPHLDAEGRMQGDPVMIRGWCCPKRSWSIEQIEEMLTSLQNTKREDGLGVIERYTANGTECLWMPGFESEQIGLQKDHEAKGKYGYSDIPYPPSKLLKTKAKVEPVVEDTNFIEELRPKYPHLNLDEEWEKCKLWWSEGKREMKRPKSAFINWLSKAKVSNQLEPKSVETGDNMDGFEK
ncbi:hypothetical protein LCGC14_2548150 [marine sediment metagenome]|uniref:Uncharacterized protein n=1 Tax=marine sediment metagenome TaxID=412755 RepID=A0A0F9D039_9ZZZZ